MLRSKLYAAGAVACLLSIPAFAGPIVPHFFNGTDGSTVSSPITFESFFVSAPVAPAFTDAIFVFTINDDNSSQTNPTLSDSVQLFYGALTSDQQNGNPPGSTPPFISSTLPGDPAVPGTVKAFDTPCKTTINVTASQATATTYGPLDCTLSGTDGDPNTVGSFAYDFENGNGVSLVLACYSDCTNTQDKFFFTPNAGGGDTSLESLTLLPPAGVPEPSAISLVMLGAIAMLGWRSRLRSRAIVRARR